MQIIYEKTYETTNTQYCVFAHFDAKGLIKPYVCHYLNALKKLGFINILVSTSPFLAPDTIEAASQYADVIILRENAGYDFGSYRVGIEFIQAKHMNVERLLITNDSVFGPLRNIKHVIENSNEFDLYSITDSFSPFYHLQSYFIIYNQKAINSSVFKEFWNSVENLSHETPNFKQEIIRRYEVGGSQLFIKTGFSLGAAFPYQKIISKVFGEYIDHLDKAGQSPYQITRYLLLDFNSSHCYWDHLIDLGGPFLKRELLTKNPTNTDISRWPNIVQETSSYSLEFILEELYSSTGKLDFLYVTAHEELARKILDSGIATVTAHPVLEKWIPLFSAPTKHTYIFDEEYYLQKSPDVFAALQTQQISSAIEHFRTNGFLEGRPWRLINREEHTTSTPDQQA